MKVRDILDYFSESGEKVDFFGDKQIEIKYISNLKDICEHSICWVKNKKFADPVTIEKLRKTNSVLVVSPFIIDNLNCLVTEYPKGIFFSILNKFFSSEFNHVISEKATVLTDKIGKNVHIGANCYIEKDVSIGNNTIVYPNVSIVSPCAIGENCIIFPGVVIGADGFGYYFQDDVPVREKHFMGVKIGDNVDIGANTCIDRGLLTDTVIEANVKIDNLCHIGHNAVIKENCLVIAGTIICGSSVIEKNAYLSPGAVVLNQLTIEEKAKVGANSLAISRVKAGSTIFGVPGKKIAN